MAGSIDPSHMIYRHVGLNEDTLQALNGETLKIWNATSWKLGIVVTAGFGIDDLGKMTPDAEDREMSARILEKALKIVKASTHRYHSNIRNDDPEKLFTAAKRVCDLYRKNPDRSLSREELETLFV